MAWVVHQNSERLIAVLPLGGDNHTPLPWPNHSPKCGLWLPVEAGWVSVEVSASGIQPLQHGREIGQSAGDQVAYSFLVFELALHLQQL